MTGSSPPFRRIGLIGVGLIGGSIGLALKSQFGDQVEVLACDPATPASEALARGAVDSLSTLPGDACGAADLVILAAPAGVIPDLLPELPDLTRSGVVVTDVAGVKTAICAAGRASLDRHGVFVGGHPMAGSEKSGLAAARPDLFEGTAWVLCPAPDTPHDVLGRLRDLVERLGARPVLLEPDRHDRAVSRISHLPQLLAVALLNLVARDPAQDDLEALAGRGFADLTRVGSSAFPVWRDVLAANSTAVREALGDLSRLLGEVETDLGSSTARVETLFREAGRVRERIQSASLDAEENHP